MQAGSQQWRAALWSVPPAPGANRLSLAYPAAQRLRRPATALGALPQPQGFAGKRVLVVGGGNSGAQILAEVSKVADTLWITPEPPAFLPDEVDGRVLFERATERWKPSRKAA